MLKNALSSLKSENNKNMQTLSEPLQMEINNSVQYVRAKGVSQYESELLRKDLISMYFERTIRNEEINFSDAKNFCDTFAASCTKHTLEPALYTLYYFSGILLIYLIFDFLACPAAAQITAHHIFRNISLLIIIMISRFILPRFTLSRGRISEYIGTAITWGLFFVLYSLFNRTVHITVLFTVPWGVCITVHLLFYIAMTFFWNRYNCKISVMNNQNRI